MTALPHDNSGSNTLHLVIQVVAVKIIIERCPTLEGMITDDDCPLADVAVTITSFPAPYRIGYSNLPP